MIILRKSCYNLCFLLAALSCAIWLSSQLDNYQIADSRIYGQPQNDVLYKVFGQLRKDLAAFCYLKADRYFHRGTQHADEHEHCFDNELDFEQTDSHGPEHAHHTQGTHAPKTDLFSRIERTIHYRPVTHLQTIENTEIIPWFKITTIINPHFEKAYLDGSYWLSMRMGQSDKALAFLRKGLRYNPRSWQIAAQIGNIHFINRKDFRKAYSYYKHAYKHLRTAEHTMIEEKQVLSFLSACAEKLGKKEEYRHYEEKLSELGRI